MVKKSHSPEKIITKLREAEFLLNQGANVGEACRKIGVTEQTCLPVAQRIRRHAY